MTIKRLLTRLLAVACFLISMAGPVCGATVDVMIVYDSTARSWVNAQGGMSAFAADAVARMNQATANSNVDLTFRLVHAAEAPYTHSGDLSTDLGRLQAGTGNLAVVHQWRNTYAADVVAMLVDTGSAYGTVGMGYLLDSYRGDPDYAYSVNAVRSVNLSHTLTHEVGHNLGCHHSKFQRSSPGPNPYLNSYSAGWYFTGTNGTPYHTIMAYDDDGYGRTYIEAPLFSTPLRIYQGTSAGDAMDGDNARNIRSTMDIVAAYRSSIVCTYTLTPENRAFSAVSGTGSVAVTASSAGCSWAATSNASWITITAGQTGTGNGSVAYAVAVNGGAARTGTVTIAGKTFTVTQEGASGTLYFPHVATDHPWQTEIAVINTGSRTVTGTLKGYSHAGLLLESKGITLPARGRRQLIIADEFAQHAGIGYMIFEADSSAIQGYTKFYIAGTYRAAIPAAREPNTWTVHLPHIASSDQWWTGLSLVNTTATAKQFTLIFNTGQSRSFILKANEHKAFQIRELFDGKPQPDIQSAVMTNAGGVIGLLLFGSACDGNLFDGLPLSGKTASTLYVPHVASDAVWWTGIAAYNPSSLAGTLTVTPYNAQGTALAQKSLTLSGRSKYVGLIQDLGLPAGTAWFRIDSTRPLTGFELFATYDGNQMAAYSDVGGTGVTAGIFPKIEQDGWTGVAFVNTENEAATVTLTAYRDDGTAAAVQALSVGPHAKVVGMAEEIFPQGTGGAAYIAFTASKKVVGFQLNGSSDGMMLDGLPALGVAE